MFFSRKNIIISYFISYGTLWNNQSYKQNCFNINEVLLLYKHLCEQITCTYKFQKLYWSAHALGLNHETISKTLKIIMSIDKYKKATK